MTKASRSGLKRLKLITAGALPLMLMATACGTSGGGGGGTASDSAPVTINVAVVSNPDEQRLEKALPEFEKKFPNIKVTFTTLDEITLRDKLSQDISTQSGQFDAAMVGVVETPQWAANDWLVDLTKYSKGSADYDVDDLLPPIRSALTVDDKLYAVPFTGESSFVYYREDLFEQKGLTMPADPTWDQIQEYAAELTDREKNLAGICLRGQAGWGSNLPTMMSLIHAYGGHIYDTNFVGGFDQPEAKRGFQQYIDMIRASGEKGAANSSFQECQNLFNQGKAAMWYDATSVAGPTFNPKDSKFADQTAVAKVPQGTVAGGGWMWSWAFVMLKTSKNQDATWKFMEWATSKDYIDLAGQQFGWNLVPPGTRTSTYQNPEYQKAAAPYADLSLATINAAKTQFDGATDSERASWVDIPEWPATGDKLGKIFSAAVVGDKTIDQAMTEANEELTKTAESGGYAK